MIVDLPRRWRWVIGVTTGFVIALAVVFVIATRPPGNALIAQAAAVVRSSVVSPNVAAAVVAQEPVRAAEQSHGVDEIQICGGNWIKLREDGAADEEEVSRATNLPQIREQVLAKLQANPSELSRATALILETPSFDDASDAVARLVVNSTDPRAYALGVKLCVNRRETGACQLISPRRWAQLDATEATPWFYLLDEAKARGDRGAQDEALHRIATAQRSDSLYWATAGAIMDASPTTDSALPATLLMIIQVIGVEAAVTKGGYQVMNASCKGESLRDSNRAQTCAAIADVLTDRSTTVIDRMIGVAIGRNIGWPEDRVDLARAQTNAYRTKVATLVANDPDGTYSCGSLRRQMTQVRHLADVGETGAMREWVAQSGKTPQDFIQAERDGARRSAEASAASAAEVAASAASSAGP